MASSTSGTSNIFTNFANNAGMDLKNIVSGVIEKAKQAEYDFFVIRNEDALKKFKDLKITDPASSKCFFAPESELSSKFVYYIRNPNGGLERRYDLSTLDDKQRRMLFSDIKSRNEKWRESDTYRNILSGDGKLPKDKGYEKCFPDETEFGKGSVYYTINDSGEVIRKYDNLDDTKKYKYDKFGTLIGEDQSQPSTVPKMIGKLFQQPPKITSSDGFGNIKHSQSGKCLDGNGNSVYFGDCQEDNSYQQWRMNGKTLQHKASGKCLDVSNNRIGFSPCTTWTNENDLLQHEDSKKCLDGNGNSVYLGPCGKDNQFQKWKPVLKSTFGNKDDLMQYLNYDGSVSASEIRSTFKSKDYFDKLGTDWARLGRIETYTTASLTKPLHEQKLSTYTIDDSADIVTDNERSRNVKPADSTKQKKHAYMNFMPQE